MTSKEIMLQARRTLERRRDAEEARLRAADDKNHADCMVRGDAIAIGCAHVEIKQLKKHPDWHCYEDHDLEREKPEDFLPYKHIARFESNKTGSLFWLYSERQGERLSNYRIQFYPEDKPGLQFEEISSVMENGKGVKIARFEVAIDCGRHTGIDSRFIRRHFVSGKCKANSANSWGRRNGTKFIRSYFKEEIGAHRLELQLNWRFLRTNKIDDIVDFRKLVQLLPEHHILFGEIDDVEVIKHLRKKWTATKAVELLKRVQSLEGNLLEQLAVLREAGHLKNTRRLLKVLPINQRITEALKEWAAKWPTAPSRLGRTP
jgi:hypothetical protein